MHLPLPLTRDLVLIGGGHAHALVLRMWGMKPLAGVRVTVINPGPQAPYSGMLPGLVAGHYETDDLMIDLVKLGQFSGARLIVDHAVGIDRAARQVVLKSGRCIRYDVLSVDVGISTEMPNLPGFAAHGVPVKPMIAFHEQWLAFLDRVAAGNAQPKAVVIGGGVGGIEIAMAMAHRMRDFPGCEVTLIQRSHLLGGESPRVARKLRAEMARRGVTLIEGKAVRELAEGRVIMDGGDAIASDFTTGIAGARPAGWLADTGLSVTDGYVDVGPTLQTPDDADIFAAGDCAHLSHAPRPKAGAYAVRAATPLFENLRARLMGRRPGPFHPQGDFLKLMALGGKSAIAEKRGIYLGGPLMWRWKDRIDRGFMAKFHQLLPMAGANLPADHALGLPEALGDKPMCGGCGSKVGGSVLDAELARLADPKRDDVLAGAGDDAAWLKGPGGKSQLISTDHLRVFTADPRMMARIAAIHALGDIWAKGAAPQVALATLVLPRLSQEMQADMLAEITAGAGEVFAAEGAAIVGGHTSVGAELTVGFTVTGLADRPIGLDGGQPGDRLVLTKPIGSGTVMAGAMALKARGDWVLAALASMSKPQGDAARILADVAHAMTDVTGFGLAGHALDIARASGVQIGLNVSHIPYLPGATALAADGVRSTLFADNLALAPTLLRPDCPETALLFDPQTAGGLLALVPDAAVQDIVSSLTKAGYVAAIIGYAEAGEGRVILA